MKSSSLRPALALALALALSACGGSASFSVNGTVGGLEYPGLVLSNNGADLPIAVGTTTFSFPGSLEYGDTFDVQIKANPAHQTCETDTRFSTGTAGRTASINVPIACRINTFPLGGKVTGLTTDGLVLINGTTGGTIGILKGAAGFAFPVQVAFGQSYGVTVLTQPAGQTCVVSNGIGVMGDAKVDNVEVTCNTSIGG